MSDTETTTHHERRAPRDDRLRTWLEQALADADRRGLPELKPLIESLAASTEVLRAADWNEDAAR
jgi:hypothetical protein